MSDDRLGAYVPQLLQVSGADGPAHWQAQGTLVFADVSGFTRLTEKLSREGKAGAEEIVRTISDVFTALLTATADGGDVLKFSGDALLLFYDAPDHVQRACRAALTMQRKLRLVGGIDSSRGRVRLRMSVGVNSGTFSFFLCGGDHLELYVLGRAASTTVAAEAAAQAGEVLVSDDTAVALHGATFGSRRRAGVVLRSVPTLQPAPAGATTIGTTLRRFIAPPLRDRLERGDIEHEHRRATVGFAHFGGVDDLLDTVGAAEVFDRVQALTVASMDALDEYGVLLTATDVGSDGGKLMLTAGAPDATGDEEARMLRVARRIVDTDAGLPVKVGVNAGDLFVGTVGAPFRRTYSTMGAATNLAARVMGAASWDSVLATSDVIAEVGDRFLITPVPPFPVKGRDEPVHAAIVDGAAGATGSTADMSVPFVGREHELEVLVDALTGARDGRGGVVHVLGDPGAGKSRLVTEVRTRAGQIDWAGVSCDPYERTSPYQAAAALLRRILGIEPTASADAAGTVLRKVISAVAPELLEWAPLIAVAVNATVEMTPQAADVAPRYRRGRTHQAVGDLLAAVATEPSLIVIEDAEHMDDASAELTAALLARMLPARPWLVIITSTDNAAGLHPGRGYDAIELRLAPLDVPTATDLAARLAERTPVPAHLLPQIVDRAAGNPLFLAALVAAQATTPGELPRSVEAIVAARIDELDPDDRRALRYLSVLGDRFTAELLDETLAPLGIDSGQADRWLRLSEFVIADERSFAFRNALVREVAYEGLTFRRRRELHARVADAIDGERPTSQLPLHLIRAERWDRAWTTARTAAADARDRGANAVAAELYEMALRAARRIEVDEDEVARTAIDAGEVWERAGLWQRALDTYAIAAACTHGDADLLLVMLRRGRTHEGAGRYPQALRLYRRVLTSAIRLPPGADRERCLARAHCGYASARLGQSRPADAIGHAHDAVEHAQAAGDDESLAQAYHLLDRAHAALEDHATAARYRDRALPVFAALGDLAAQGTVLYDLGADAQRADKLDEALWLYERSYEVRTRAGDVVRAAESANAIGEVLIMLGRSRDAHDRFAEALRTWRGARSPRGVAEATHNLGVAALRGGDADQAISLLDEAADLATRIGAEGLHRQIQLPLAEALLARGRYVEAWEAAGRALGAADAHLTGRAHRLRGEALLRTGGTARARVELTTAVALADTAGDHDGRAEAQTWLDRIDHA
jgi:class 3 adenylate cyclase/tetratricopeptide (TPR) repeat protein